MKQIKAGIMPLNEFQEYTRAIVTGKHKRKRGEPKIWFNSMASLALSFAVEFDANTQEDGMLWSR